MAVTSRLDIEHIILSHGDELRALGVKRLGLFGSFVRGEQNELSDVDLLVEFVEGEKSFDHFMAVADRLEEWMGRRVELITPDGMSPHIAPHIRREIEYVAVAA